MRSILHSLATTALFAATVLVFTIGAIPAAGQGALESVADGKAGERSPAGEVLKGAVPAEKTAATTCVSGMSGGFPCKSIDLVSFMPRATLGAASNIRLNEIWGWMDPVDGTEYALVGREDGVAFVDISAPESPRYIGELLLHPGNAPQVWRDFKVYADHLFVVADGQGSSTHGMQVFDLGRLRAVTGAPVTFTEDAHYDGVGSAHNIAINEISRHAFIVGVRSSDRCETGLHMVDVSTPTAPAFAGCFRDDATTSGYTHDVQCVTYHGPDSRYTDREICVGSNVSAVVVADVTDKQNPVTLGAGQYPQSRYIHQGWFTDDHRYFIQDDELDERSYGHGARTRIWDMAELDDPVLVATYESPLPAIDHNLFVRGDLVYAANYASGLRVLNITDVTEPREVAWFDTHPSSDEANFDGAWGSYPFFGSGNIIVSSRDEGLFVVRLQDVVRVSVTDVTVDVRPTDHRDADDRWDAHVKFQVSGEDRVERIEVGTSGRTTATAQPGPATAAGKTAYGALLTGLPDGVHDVEISVVGKDGSRTVAASSSVVVLPDAYALSEPAPNPAVTLSAVSLALREAQTVRAELYDASGRNVSTVFDGQVQAGVTVDLSVDTSGLPAGVYFLRVTGRDFSDSRKIVVVI